MLWDLVTAAKRIQGFVEDKTWNDYAGDLLLRSGVERQFEIAGEAMSGDYAEVNNRTVWQTATQNLDEVVEAVSALLAEGDPPNSEI